MKTQKDAVCALLISALTARDIEYTINGKVCIKDVLTPEDKKSVREQLCEGFEAGEIAMTETAREKYIGNPVKLNQYVNGLVNNWIRKNPEFNNGVAYKAKNPGSRAGQGDDSIKAMRALLKTVDDEAVKTDILKSIDARLQEIAPHKVVTINKDALPEHLQHLA